MWPKSEINRNNHIQQEYKRRPVHHINPENIAHITKLTHQTSIKKLSEFTLQPNIHSIKIIKCIDGLRNE